MPKCISDVIAAPANVSAGTNDVSLPLTYPEALGKAVKFEVGNGDMKTCTEILYDWIEDTLGLNVYSATAAFSPLVLSANLNLGAHDYNLTLPDLTLSAKLCKLYTGWWAYLQASIEIISKAAFALYAQIEEAIQALEKFVKEAVDKVFICLDNIIKDIKERLSKLGVDADFGLNGSLTLGIDISSLQTAIVSCPCLCKAMAHILSCNEDSDGNDISDDPNLVFQCLQNKLKNIGVAGKLGTGFDVTLGDLICDNLMYLYKMIMKAIDFAFELLMAPLRALIRAYAELLNKKFDVTGFISALGVMKCFFRYSTDVKSGVNVYQMSAIDIIYTMKDWTTCLKSICPSLTDDIKAKIKELNEDLRLSPDFWGNVLAADLYDMCIAAKLNYPRLSETSLKTLYEDNPKNTFSNYISKLEGSGISEAVNSYKKRNRYRRDERSAIQEAITFVSAPDNENGVNTGEKPITESDEKLCISASDSLGLKSSAPFFVEKFYQLLRMLSQYAMDKDTVKSLTDILDKCNGKKFQTNMSKEFTPFPASPNARKESLDYPDEKRVTYHLENDYNASEINSILGAYA